MTRRIPATGECQTVGYEVTNTLQHIGQAMAFHACETCVAFGECFEEVVSQEEAEIIYQIMQQRNTE